MNTAGLRILRYYLVYRALVRAKVAALHCELGLKILGGCCGTDDRHIRALAEELAILSGR